MSKKLERQLYGPGMMEVLLGAAVSLALGVVLAACFLIFTPVAQVRELPKERVEGMVYYVQGSRDSSRAREASAKQKAFLEGASITLNEDEINSIVTPNPLPTTLGKKLSRAPGATGTDRGLTAGSPNFRMKENVLQIAVPLQVAALGFEQTVIVQTRGGFAKNGDVVEFVPAEFYLGSCPLQRLPALQEALFHRLMASVSVPPELSAAWVKLSAAAVDGSNLHLSMP